MQTAAAVALIEQKMQRLVNADVCSLASPPEAMRTNALDKTRSNEEDNAVAAAIADEHGANSAHDIVDDDACNSLNDSTRDISDDDETNVIVEEDATGNASAESMPMSRTASPARHVGHVRISRAPQLVTNVTDAPPRRRAASVFGTCGREIVTYPARAANAVPNDAASVQALPGDRERAADARSDVVIVVQEKENSETEAQVERDMNDDVDAATDAGRRVYVRFKTLSAESSTAYIHVLLSLFTDYPGEDVIALVFDDAQPFSENCDTESGTIAAPNRVDYDEISEAVQNIVGEDAVVEIIE